LIVKAILLRLIVMDNGKMFKISLI
jgi:hypothetical protein